MNGRGKRFFAPTLRDLFWLAVGLFLGVGLFILLIELAATKIVAY